MIHVGSYRFAPIDVAFRNDFCVRCNAERTAICERTFDVLHVFWIPVLPLGYFRRWYCMVCRKRPDFPRTARRSIKWLAAIALAAITVLIWFAPSNPGEEWIMWGFRIGSVLLLAGAFRWIAVGSDDVVRRERLATLRPSRAVTCPVCEVGLIPGATWRCPSCGMERM